MQKGSKGILKSRNLVDVYVFHAEKCQAMSSYRDGSSHLFHLQGQTTLFGVFNHCSPYTELTHPTKTTQRCKYKPEAKVGGPGAKSLKGRASKKISRPQMVKVQMVLLFFYRETTPQGNNVVDPDGLLLFLGLPHLFPSVWTNICTYNTTETPKLKNRVLQCLEHAT